MMFSVCKTEDKRVVHSFTFSLSFSYNRFFLYITVYIKTIRQLGFDGRAV
jgi:hypothetical protein